MQDRFEGGFLQSKEAGIDEGVIGGNRFTQLGSERGDHGYSSRQDAGAVVRAGVWRRLRAGWDPGFVNDPILGIFEVNALHNIVHLAVGAVWIFASNSVDTAKTVNLSFGVVYLLLALLGFVAGDFMEDLLDIGSENQALADNLLHLATGILGVYFGTAGAGPVTRPTATP